MIPRDAHYNIVQRTVDSASAQTIFKDKEDLYSFKSRLPSRPVRRVIPQIRTTYEWSSLHTLWFNWNTHDLIRQNWTPFVEWTAYEIQEFSPLDRMTANLLVAGRVTEEYVVDLYSQVEIFEENRAELELKFVGKEVVICGGRVFTGVTFDEAVRAAQTRFPGRPYHAVSFSFFPAAM